MKKRYYLSAILLVGCGEQSTSQVQGQAATRDAVTISSKPAPIQVPETELDRMNGFGDVHFGDSPDKLRDAREEFRSGSFTSYAQYNKVKYKNKTAGESIFWGFTDDKLTSVMYVVNGVGIEPFLKTFRTRFGEPTMQHDTMFWRGSTVLVRANVRGADYNPHKVLMFDSSHEPTLDMKLEKLPFGK